MKKKIATVAILTITIFVFSVILINKLTENIASDDLTLFGNKSATEVTQSVADIPVFQERNIGRKGGKAYSPAGSESNSYNSTPSRSVFSSKNDESNFFTSGNFLPAENPSYSRSSKGLAQNNYSAGNSFSGLSLGPLLSQADYLLQSPASDTKEQSPLGAARIEQIQSNISAPFSNSSPMNRPMFMRGDGENPPGEGAPVGDGIFLLIGFAALYFVFHFRKLKA